jgi:predicted nucleic acid-binding protein
MSAKGTREFVDANVLVYAYDSSAGAKQAVAAQLLTRLWDERRGCLSVQVLQEFFVIVTKKVRQPLVADDAAACIRDLASWKIFAPAAEDVLAAIALHRQASISFWDAMAVEAAAQSDCDVLWTEDLSDGQVLRGVRIQNPFSTRQG